MDEREQMARGVRRFMLKAVEECRNYETGEVVPTQLAHSALMFSEDAMDLAAIDGDDAVLEIAVEVAQSDGV